MEPVMMTHMLSASIGSVAEDAWNAIRGLLGDFISWLMDTTIVSWLMELMKAFITFILTWSDSVYDTLVGKAYDLLTQSPKDWSPEAWEVIKSINSTLINTIGISLVVVFFAIGFCKNSLDPHQELRFETILKMFIKLSIAAFFMYNSIYIVAALFGLVGIVAGTDISATEGKNMAEFFGDVADGIPAEMGELARLLVIMLMSLVYTIASAGVEMMIVYQAFTRFFKILVIIPYGSIASTTLAGDHHTAQSAASFYKYALNCILEAATMVIALYIYAKISGSVPEGLGLFNDPAQDLSDVIGRMFTELILMMTMYGVIKQSSAMTQRALGL